MVHEPWESVEIEWRLTQPGRRKEAITSQNIIEFYNEWPLLRDAKGFRLIEIDFNEMYPAKSSLLLEK